MYCFLCLVLSALGVSLGLLVVWDVIQRKKKMSASIEGQHVLGFLLNITGSIRNILQSLWRIFTYPTSATSGFKSQVKLHEFMIHRHHHTVISGLTIQPNQETQKRQFEIWTSLILNYCKHNKIFILDKTQSAIPLFQNADISRQLSPASIETILKDMAKNGFIEWTDQKEERCFVLWHSLAEWGDLLYTWANNNGLANSVATFYELVNPSPPTEFSNLDYALLTKCLESLQSRGKAELIDPEGITGGSSGIGKELAILAAQRGAHVTIVARSVSKLEEASKEIRTYTKSNSQNINFFNADVTNFEETENVITRCEVEVGPIDILVCCAGYSYPSRLEDIPMKHIKGMMDLNFMGAVNVVRSTIHSMKSRRRGKIVLVSSVAGLVGLFGYTGYSASKFALRGFGEALQMEVKHFNIDVTISFPPDTETPCLVEEDKTKPLETKLIGETAGVWKPEVVAKSILESSLAGDFFSCTGFDSNVSSIMCAGMSPASSVLSVILQALFMGPLRLVGLGYIFYFNRMVAKCASNREKQKKSE